MVAAAQTLAGHVRVRVEPRGAMITAVPGTLLLDALRQAQLPISYSCLAGRCGTCRCELIAGEVIEDPGCEFRSGPVATATRHVLACRTRLMADCVVGLVEPDEVVTHPAQILKCRVESIDRLNESTLAVRLRPNRPLQFTAGQFAKLDFGADLVRPYSMANAEGVELLEFHLRRVPGGKVTGFVNEQLRPGHWVKLIGPLGTSYLRRRHGGPMLLVGGGTGLAPIMSIARTVLGSTAQRPLHIYVGARSEAELYDVEQLRALERSHPRLMHLSIGVDGPPRDPSVRQGLITELIAADLTSLRNWKVYLAGPPPMVEAGIRLAIRLGADSNDVHADAFYPAVS